MEINEIDIAKLYDALLEEHYKRQREKAIKDRKTILNAARQDYYVALDLLHNNWITEEEFESIMDEFVKKGQVI